MAIGAVIFDLGRTLIPFSFDALAPALEPCRDAVMQAVAVYEVGACSWDAFQSRLSRLTGIAPERLREWWCGIFTLQPLVAPSLIAGVRNRCRVGLLSNTNECHFRYLSEKLPWLAGFDFYTLSYQVGAAKPKADIYAAAEEQAQCDRREILYFDDVAEFVQGARGRGWQAELFTGERDLRAVLARHGVAAAGAPST